MTMNICLSKNKPLLVEKLGCVNVVACLLWMLGEHSCPVSVERLDICGLTQLAKLELPFLQPKILLKSSKHILLDVPYTKKIVGSQKCYSNG